METAMFDTSNLTAADVMTRDVVTVHPSDSLREAAHIMLERGISGLPVVDAAGKVVGVISEADLIRPDEHAEQQARWWLDILAEGENLSTDFLAAISGINRPVSKVMRKDLIAVTENTSLAEVAQKIVRENVRRVLVMHEHRLVGIVARRDLVRVLARGK
jgi:CBS domain-containing protein